MTSLKEDAAQQALEMVEPGMRLGLGSGSTSEIFIHMVGERWQAGELPGLRTVATSLGSARLAGQHALPLFSLAELGGLDLAVDGADEIDPQLGLIKGLGKALLREKVIAVHSRRFVVIADESKLVPRLGRGPLPVEVLPFEWEAHVRWLGSLGCRAELWRLENGEPLVTDNGNYYARCWFADGIEDAQALANALAARPGIIEHGLFLELATEAVIAGQSGIRRMGK